MRRENSIGDPFIELSEVDSSNNYAMRQVQAQMAEHGSTWFVFTQTAGKGQRGKTWNTEPGQNIIMSVIAEPALIPIGNQFILSAFTALSCYDFFNRYALDETKIKWPNDIYWKDRKAGGILIENSFQGTVWKFSVIGIGININQTLFPDSLAKAVSLKQITGKSYDVVAMAKELCACLEKRWQLLKQAKPDELIEEYNSYLYKLNEKVTFKKDAAVFNATIKGANKQGELVVNTGTDITLPFGTVEWII